MNIEILIAKLMEFYNIKTITELAQIINTTQPTISGWRSRNAVGALVEKVAEHDNKVLEYIFTSPSNTQAIQTISDGQVAQNVNGDMVGRDKVDGTVFNQHNPSDGVNGTKIGANEFQPLFDALVSIAKALKKEEILKNELTKLMSELPLK